MINIRSSYNLIPFLIGAHLNGNDCILDPCDDPPQPRLTTSISNVFPNFIPHANKYHYRNIFVLTWIIWILPATMSRIFSTRHRLRHQFHRAG